MHEALHLHRTWQGGKGSGLTLPVVGMAALFAFKMPKSKPELAHNLGWQIVWSGISAATTDHIGHFDEWRKMQTSARSIG